MGFYRFFLFVSVQMLVFSVKNGAWCVYLRGLGDIGEKNASKNVKKLAKIGINFNKFGKIKLFWQKFIKIHTFLRLTFC